MTDRKGFISRTTKIVIAVFLFGVATLLLIGLFKFGSLLAFFMVYPWILSKVSGYGFNDYISQIIAVVVTVIVLWVVLKLVLSWNRNKRTAGYILLALVFITHFLFMFLVTKESYFYPTTGVPIKYYTTNPLTGEIQVFERPIYDAFGHKAEPVTPKISRELEARKMYPNAEIPAEKITNFFDRSTGNALVYYALDPDGTYHFFVQPGYSTITGEPLKAVTPEIVADYLKDKKEKEIRRERARIQRKKEEKQREKKDKEAEVQIQNESKTKEKKIKKVLRADYEILGYDFRISYLSKPKRLMFTIEEKNGVEIQVESGELKVWYLENNTESPSSYKSRDPKVYPKTFPTPIKIPGKQRKLVTINIEHWAYLPSYALRPTPFWLEIDLIGKDSSGNKFSLHFEHLYTY